jgi:plastocyanin
MSIGITGLSMTPSSANAPTYTWYQPNGSTLSSLTNLPATGAYAVMITTGSNATATNLQYWLSADITGVFQLNTATNLAVTRPGQHVRYTFQGSTGDHIRFGTTATNAAPIRLATYVFDPSGNGIISGGYFNSVTGSNATVSATLSATGAYTVLLQPNPYDNPYQTWSTTFAVSKDVDAPLTIDGPSTPASTTVVGQEIRATFSAIAGQNLCFGYSNFSVTPSNATGPIISVYKPDGTALSSLVNLPQTGTYTIVATPTDSTLSSSMQLWLSTEQAGTLSYNTAINFAVTRPGQHVRYTFQGTQGDHVRFGTTATNAGPVRLATYVFDPSGTAIISGGYFDSTTGNNATASATLSVTGTYTVLLQPDRYDNPYQTWSTTFAVSKDVDAALTVDGPSMPVSTTVVGQEIRATFSATAGQNLAFGISNLSYTPSNAAGLTTTLYKPDGTALLSLVNLPQTGTYTVVVTPNSAMTSSSMQLWVSSDLSGTFTLNTATPLSVSRPAQRARYTFQGSQGDHVRFGTTSTTTSGGVRLSTYVYAPSGALLVDGTSFVSTQNGNSTYSATLPATGTYTVVMQIDYYDDPNQTWATTFAVSKDVDAPLTIDGPSTPASTTVVGQEIRATFSATAGQNLGFAYTNLSLTPSNAGSPLVSLYKPDGTGLLSLLNLPQTGTYTILVKPTDATTALSMQLWLSTEATGTLALNTATPLSVSRPGQHGRYTFQGTQGQIVTFTATSTSSNPANQTIAVYGYKPDGSSLISSGYFVANSNTTTYTTGALPVTGTYSIYIAINPYDNIYATWATTLTVAPH